MTELLLPTHVAIIPDGNRRWAKAHNQSSVFGHKAGAKTFENITRQAGERGIKHLSFWGMSLDNFTKRDPIEVAGLLKIFYDEFTRLAQDPEVHDRQMRVNAIGKWQEKFPLPVRRAIKKALTATAHYTNHYLNFFLAYNGLEEMAQAIKKIIKDDIDPTQITPELIKQNLYTKDLPPVDLAIRSGGEPHNSNGFMMWDTADAQLFFTEKLWPDFSTQDFDQALNDYTRRQRRFGQ